MSGAAVSMVAARALLLKVAKLAALLVLAGYVLLVGIVPAFSRIDADFPGYYTAARIVTDGRSTDRLYDDGWFREQMRDYGLESAKNPGKFAPFPPPTALLLVPLTSLRPLTALRVVTLVSVVCLLVSSYLLASILAWGLLDAALFVLAAGLCIVGGLRCGQPYILISTFCLCGYWLWLAGRPWMAGIVLGVFVPIKYYPVVILAGLALRREWKVVWGGVIAILAVALLSIAVLGWKVHEIFLLSVLGKHLTGHLSLQAQAPPFTAVYQSFDSLFSRLFVADPLRNPHPLWAAPSLRTAALLITKAALLLIGTATLLRVWRREPAALAALAIAILGILVLLIAPATAVYMCVLLWLPVGLLSDYFLSRGARMPAYLVLGAYVLIGFFPYGHAYVFEGRGGLSVLAFPRLLLLLAMFVVCVGFVARPQAAPRAAAATHARVPN